MTGRLSYRQAVAALFETTDCIAKSGASEFACMRRWGKGYAVYVRHESAPGCPVGECLRPADIPERDRPTHGS